MLFKLLKLEAIPKSATVMILVITTVEINETIIVCSLKIGTLTALLIFIAQYNCQ